LPCLLPPSVWIKASEEFFCYQQNSHKAQSLCGYFSLHTKTSENSIIIIMAPKRRKSNHYSCIPAT
jgi:hypothetical protein